VSDDRHDIKITITCPVCNGAGQVREAYAYRTQHKYDGGAQVIQHAETCWLCGGENNGHITRQQHDEWLRFEENPVCPLCNGTGGRRYWSWLEGEQGSQKTFSFTPCRVCGGRRHVSPERVYAFEREKQQLRFWGLGCAALVVVVVIVGATRLLTALLNGTPWFRCCPMPGFIPLGVVLLHYSRRILHDF
jgi:hypothetical protein